MQSGAFGFHSPFAVAEVGTTGSFVEGLLVRLKVQGSDQCFLQQTARAVLEPGGEDKETDRGDELVRTPQNIFKQSKGVLRRAWGWGRENEVVCVYGEKLG
jgi:hypothetical protein